MRQLTQAQIAAGWVAVPDESMTMPMCLHGLGAGTCDFLYRNGVLGRRIPPVERAWDFDPIESDARIVAYRILKSPEKQATEQAAFEDWADATCPSGDCESVQYQWARSDARAEWLDEQAADPNAEMLARDQRPETPSPSRPLIWPTPWQKESNLTRVAGIGFRAWGEQS